MSIRLPLAGALALALAAFPSPATAQEFVWWEGEAAAEHNFNARDFPPSAYGERRDGLSEGNWLFNGGPRQGAEVLARWQVAVPAPAAAPATATAPAPWHFWTRKFWKHGPFRWRFDEREWQTCGRDCALADSFELATHVCANWVYLGAVDLPAGTHTLEIRLLAAEGENAVACFDAFLLTSASFHPRGKLKPGQKSGRAAEGWWAFEPDPDRFDAGALLDLRPLNEREAGAAGFVRADGDGFLLGDGKSVRFWGVNVGPEIVRLPDAQLEYLAARLAKCGVNLVRIHGAIFDRHDPARIDTALVARVHACVAALRRQGIYSALSFYFPLWVEPHPFAQIYFDPELQDRWQGWARALLAAPATAGGRPLGQDPAVAFVELVNEDSLFFWTFTARTVSAPHLAALETRFGAWLARARGTLARALGRWPGARHPRDDAAGGRAGLFDAWDMTGDGLAQASADKRSRISDQVRFLAEVQRGFHEDSERWLRETLGVKCLVSAGNWKTADDRVLGPVDRWTCTACDVIDRHGYFGGRHEGPRAAFAIDAGDRYQDRAAVLEPEAPPLPYVQAEGFPHVVTELGWTAPNRYRADGPLLASAYGALQGIDGWCWFAINGASWTESQPKFPVSDPAILGQFPAAALQYRRGDVKEGPVVFRESLSLEEVFGPAGSGAVETAALDATRARDVPREAAAGVAALLDPCAFYVGRVVRRYGASAPALRVDLARHLDRARKIVRSATGELAWNWSTGLVTVDTPRSQAAAGFLGKAGPVKLGALTIECRNEYAAIHAIALDDKPLRESKRILVQAFTTCRPFGFRADDAGRIVDLGGPPIEVSELDATVTLAGAKATKATVLDPHGYPRDPLGAVEVRAGSNGSVIALPKDALYVVIER